MKDKTRREGIFRHDVPPSIDGCLWAFQTLAGNHQAKPVLWDLKSAKPHENVIYHRMYCRGTRIAVVVSATYYVSYCKNPCMFELVMN